MPDKIQNRRGSKEGLPTLDPGEIGLCQDTEEVFIGGVNRNIPVLTLENSVGRALGIDNEATEGSDNLINSDAVYKAIQVEIGNIDVLLKTI